MMRAEQPAVQASMDAPERRAEAAAPGKRQAVLLTHIPAVCRRLLSSATSTPTSGTRGKQQGVSLRCGGR